jgi:hypothetical protein
MLPSSKYSSEKQFLLAADKFFPDSPPCDLENNKLKAGESVRFGRTRPPPGNKFGFYFEPSREGGSVNAKR